MHNRLQSMWARSVTLVWLIPVLIAGCGETTVSETPWTPLFDGESLEGWEHVGDGRFLVEDGLLRTEGGMGLLWYTERKLGDEVLRVVYQNDENSNSGVFIRIPERPDEPWMPVDRGYEVQIDDRGNDFNITGTLYSLTEAQSRPSITGQWNTMEVTLSGDRTIVRINDEVVTDYREGDPVPPKGEDWEPERGPRPREGYIGLQNHGDNEVVLFREVSVRPLNEDDA